MKLRLNIALQIVTVTVFTVLQLEVMCDSDWTKYYLVLALKHKKCQDRQGIQMILLNLLYEATRWCHLDAVDFQIFCTFHFTLCT